MRSVKQFHLPRLPLLPLLFVVVFIGLSSAKQAADLNAIATNLPTLKDPIPQATKPCTPEEAEWWNEVRAVGKDLMVSGQLRNKAKSEALWKLGRNPDDAAPYLSSQKEYVSRNAVFIEAKTKFLNLLKAGAEKSYKPPIADGKIITLSIDLPLFTEKARGNHTQGNVLINIEFRTDGTVGEMKIVRGLGDGLNDRALEAARETIFLPARKDGVFVSTWLDVSVEFSIR